MYLQMPDFFEEWYRIGKCFNNSISQLWDETRYLGNFGFQINK